MNIEVGGTVTRFRSVSGSAATELGLTAPCHPLHAGMHACL